MHSFYHPLKLSQDNLPYQLQLDDRAKQHLKVLRLRVGEQCKIIDNSGGYFIAQLVELAKQAVVELISYQVHSVESTLPLHLAQVISRGDKMDLTIQKAVELGVSEITPLFSQKCGVKLTGDRLDKKLEHWRQIIISACLQSGRTIIPQLNPVVDLNKFILQDTQLFKLQLDPRGQYGIKDLDKLGYQQQGLTILIGSESGLTLDEVAQAQQQGFQPVQLGSRILRTETAGLALIAIIQAIYGDLA